MGLAFPDRDLGPPGGLGADGRQVQLHRAEHPSQNRTITNPEPFSELDTSARST
jgi:hypothetical protein